MENKTMEVYKKLQQARQNISLTKLEKEGLNKFSNYKYFTPEQISKLVRDVCFDLKLFNKFDLIRTDLGLMARLEVIDLENDCRTSFEMATEIPEIKATNIAQQLGGCVTYSERYLLQIAYDIKDNSLDLDADKPQPKQPQKSEPKKDDKPWLTEKQKIAIVDMMRAKKPAKLGELAFVDNQSIYDYADSKYLMKKVYRDELIEEQNSILNQ